MICWKSPPISVLKLDCDGCLKGNPRPTEIGGLMFWDSLGSILLEILGRVGACNANDLKVRLCWLVLVIPFPIEFFL